MVFLIKIKNCFTLIELMIVTLIIGLLGAISIPVYMQYMAEVKANSLYSEASNYKTPLLFVYDKQW